MLEFLRIFIWVKLWQLKMVKKLCSYILIFVDFVSYIVVLLLSNLFLMPCVLAQIVIEKLI